MANGKEPDFTNFAYTKPMGADMDAFVETLTTSSSGRAGRDRGAAYRCFFCDRPVVVPHFLNCTAMIAADLHIVALVAAPRRSPAAGRQVARTDCFARFR